MTKWEHAVVEIDYKDWQVVLVSESNNINGTKLPEDRDGILAWAGNEGWELASVVITRDGIEEYSEHLYFKRPVT